MQVKTLDRTAVKTQLRDIMLDITWSKIARRYFNKSASWLYNKLNGVDGNGGESELSETEKIILKNALYDFSERIKKAADNVS